MHRYQWGTAPLTREGAQASLRGRHRGRLWICLSQDRLAVLGGFFANFTLNKESRLPIK
jgi:hypothetical protein